MTVSMPRFGSHFRVVLPKNDMSPEGAVQQLRTALSRTLISRESGQPKLIDLHPEDAFFALSRTHDTDKSAQTLDVICPDRFDDALIQNLKRAILDFDFLFADEAAAQKLSFQKRASCPDRPSYDRAVTTARQEAARNLDMHNRSYAYYLEQSAIHQPDKFLSVTYDQGKIEPFQSF